jgi:hypothetical protein
MMLTSGADKAFRTYDRDDAYRMTAAGNAELRADDDECDDFVARYYAHRANRSIGWVGVQYDYACMRMRDWSLGTVFDGDFEQLAAEVDNA